MDNLLKWQTKLYPITNLTYSKMKTTQHFFKISLFWAGLLWASGLLAQQATGERVYQIFTTHCNNAGCHNNATPAAGLDLQGSGTNPAWEVYNNVYNIAASNPVSLAKNNRLIYPGDPYRSLIFRYINNGLAGDVSLDAGEDPESIHQQLNITNVEKETIRQWILFGAPTTGQVISPALLEEFYGGNGIWALDPQNPPPAPAANEGFQIHVGPIFLPPWTTGGIQPDVEYMSKYETLLPTQLEVNRIENTMGSSHHFILYRFTDDNTATNTAYGFGPVYFTGVNMVAAYQQSGTDVLPQGTAFKWASNTVLNLNTHVTNYSSTAVVACEAYINIYTQPNGTAIQEMKTQLLPNFNISIPGDAQEHVFEANLFIPFWQSNIYIWKMGSHTHSHATDYDIWLRNSNGSKGQQIYDASHYNGIPECEYIGYDYQHPPQRVFSPFLQVNPSLGFIHRASYWNCGGCPTVTWGESVNDEMMLFGVSYVENLNGIVLPSPSTCEEPNAIQDPGTNNTTNGLQMRVLPNPAKETATLLLQSAQTDPIDLQIYDMLGKLQKNMPNIIPQAQQNEYSIAIQRDNLPSGIYTLIATDHKNGQKATARLIFE